MAEKLSIKLLQEWRDLDAERVALGRQADSIRRRQKQIEELAQQQVEAKAKKTGLLTLGGFLLRLVERRDAIAWKNIVVRELGFERVAAEEAAAPVKLVLKIEPPLALARAA